MKARKRRDFLKRAAIAGAFAGLNTWDDFSEASGSKGTDADKRQRIPITMYHGVNTKPRQVHTA